MFDLEADALVAYGIITQFPLSYEATKQGTPPGVIFSPADFVRPVHGTADQSFAILTNISEDLAYTSIFTSALL